MMIKFLSLKCMSGVCKFCQILDGFGLIMKKVALQHTIFSCYVKEILYKKSEKVIEQFFFMGK